jgi:N-acetylmuramoyl-L-alanine amidase
MFGAVTGRIGEDLWMRVVLTPRSTICVLVVLMTMGLFGLAHPVFAQTGKDPVISNLRVGQHPDKVRLVLDMSNDLSFTIFQLPDPYRIVLDLPQVSFELPKTARTRSVGSVAGWRYGLFEPGTSRLVIDAKAPLKVAAAFVLPPSGEQGHRLVLDLAPTDRDEFIVASAASIERRMANRTPRVTPTPSPNPPAVPGDNRRVVAIDPGHGGVDPGAIGLSKVYEKDLVLKVAKALKAELESRGGYKVVLTRESDVYIQLRERIAIARRAGAEMFISLHADSIDDTSLRGLSVYTLSENASDEEAASLATSENKSDIIAGMDFSTEEPVVTDILIDLAQRRTMNLSTRLANTVVEEMGPRVRLLNRPRRSAGFAVLKAPDVPSILVELGFLSNSQDEKTLRDATKREQLATGLADSIDRFFLGMQSARR